MIKSIRWLCRFSHKIAHPFRVLHCPARFRSTGITHCNTLIPTFTTLLCNLAHPQRYQHAEAVGFTPSLLTAMTARTDGFSGSSSFFGGALTVTWPCQVPPPNPQSRSAPRRPDRRPQPNDTYTFGTADIPAATASLRLPQGWLKALPNLTPCTV